MDYTHYNQFAESVRAHPGLFKLIQILNVLFTLTGFVMYPVLLMVTLLYYKPWRVMAYLLFPAVFFVLLSLFRRRFNAPRPYEVYPIQPLISKQKKGRSFPSRHIFSIVLIGGLWFETRPVTGLLILVCSLGLAIIRVLGGVHFIRDVVWAWLLGIAAALLTGWLAGLPCLVQFFGP